MALLQYLKLFVLVTSTLALNLQLNANKEYCFGVDGGEEYHIEYLVSGVNEKNVRWEARSEGNVIKSNENSNDYRTELNIPEAGANFCFKTTDAYAKVLSLTFFPVTKSKVNNTKNDILAAE